MARARAHKGPRGEGLSSGGRYSKQELLGLPIEEALQAMRARFSFHLLSALFCSISQFEAAASGLFDPLETTRATCCETLAELLRRLCCWRLGCEL